MEKYNFEYLVEQLIKTHNIYPLKQNVNLPNAKRYSMFTCNIMIVSIWEPT